MLGGSDQRTWDPGMHVPCSSLGRNTLSSKHACFVLCGCVLFFVVGGFVVGVLPCWQSPILQLCRRSCFTCNGRVLVEPQGWHATIIPSRTDPLSSELGSQPGLGRISTGERDHLGTRGVVVSGLELLD